MAFRETDFEWEFLHPRGSPTCETTMDLNCFASDSHQGEHKALPPLSEIQKTEQVQQHNEEPPMDEADDGQQSTIFEEEEDALDWGLESLFIGGEEDEADDDKWKMLVGSEPETKEKDSRKALDLKKWLRSIGLAAATLSIIVLGRGRARNRGKFIGNNQKIQYPISTKDEVSENFDAPIKLSSSSFFFLSPLLCYLLCPHLGFVQIADFVLRLQKMKDFVKNQGAISPPFTPWGSYNEWF